MKARMGLHYHVLVYSDTQVIYDYNDWEPESAINQFSAAIEGVMAANFDGIKEYVNANLMDNLESEDADEEYSLQLHTELYNAIFIKCFSLCPVSPSMN